MTVSSLGARWAVDGAWASRLVTIDDHAAAVEKAHAAVKSLARRQRRAEATGHVEQRVKDGLHDLVLGLGDGSVSTAGFVDHGVALLRSAIRDGLAAGVDHARADGPVVALKQAGIGPTFVNNMDGRFGLYAGQVPQAYEQGYGLATIGQADDPDNIAVRWNAKPGACTLCDGRNGTIFTVGTLPGWPGDGGFGKGALICEGGPHCRCTLEYLHLPVPSTGPAPVASADPHLRSVVESMKSGDPAAVGAALDVIANVKAEAQRPYLMGLLQDVLAAITRGAAALREWLTNGSEVVEKAAWDPSRHPRLPAHGPGGGRFTSIAAAIDHAIELHAEGKGHPEPLHGIERKHLLSAVRRRSGLTVPRNASDEHIARALLDHAKRAPLAKPVGPAKAAARSVSRAPATPVRARDLFTADDVAIEKTLRDVYEGKFGPYTTKVTVGIRRAGTRTDRRGRIQQVDPSVWVDGKIHDSSGHEIGRFSRSISPIEMHYTDGTVRRETWVEHHVVELGKKYQGKGFGGELNRRAIEWYRASGVHGIYQNDQNGYTWASQGFGFSGGVVPNYVAENLRNLVDDIKAGATRDRLGKPISRKLRHAPNLASQLADAEALLSRVATMKPGEAGYPTAYEFSQLGRGKGQQGKTAIWLGKHLFVPADEMILNPHEGEVIS